MRKVCCMVTSRYDDVFESLSTGVTSKIGC